MFKRLEVDVARLVADGLADDEIDETNDRRLLRHRLDVALGQSAPIRGQTARIDFLQEVVDAGLVLTIVLFDLHIDLVGVREKEPDIAPQGEREVVDGLRVEGIADEEVDILFVGAQRHHPVIARELAGDCGNGFAGKLDGELREIIVAEVFGDAVQQGGFLDDAEIDDDVGQRLARGLVLLIEFVELRLLDEPVLFQELVDGGTVSRKHQAGCR